MVQNAKRVFFWGSIQNSSGNVLLFSIHFFFQVGTLLLPPLLSGDLVHDHIEPQAVWIWTVDVLGVHIVEEL